MKKVNYLFCLLFLVLITSCNNGNKASQEENSINFDSLLLEDDPDSCAAIIEEPNQPKVKTDAIAGSYRCKRTRDAYVFYSTGDGQFYSSGVCTDFTWKRSGSNVTIKYEAFGTQKLQFNEKKRTITEKSQSLGTLVYNEE